jgi:hypothetical protein
MPRSAGISVRLWIALVATAGTLLVADDATAACQSSTTSARNATRACCVGACAGCCASAAPRAAKSTTATAEISRVGALERGLKSATCRAGNGCFCRQDNAPSPARAPAPPSSGSISERGLAATSELQPLKTTLRRDTPHPRAAGHAARTPVYLRLSHLLI